MQKQLTQKTVRDLFNYNPETGDLTWKIVPLTRSKKGATAKTKSNGYYLVRIYGKSYCVHRIIWLYVYGYFPENDIDHIDRNGQNNKISNLREVSRQCNLRNSGLQKNNKTGITGISFNKSYFIWYVRITINKKLFYLGSYDDYIEAVCVRLAAEQCLDWPNCNSNSPAYQYIKSWISKSKHLEDSLC